MNHPQRGRDRFKKYESFLAAGSRLLRTFGARPGLFVLRACRTIPGIPGVALRFMSISAVSRKCGRNIMVGDGVYLLSPRSLVLGSNVSIHPMCYIDSTGGVEIGDDVSIAHGVSILSTSHIFDSETITRDNPVSLKPVLIGSNVWIGCGVRVLGGVEIGDGAVVGAGAVVTRSVPCGSVVAGVPATQIGRVDAG